jgi:hypothetical protein
MSKDVPTSPRILSDLIDGYAGNKGTKKTPLGGEGYVIDPADGPEQPHESEVEHYAERDRMMESERILNTDPDYDAKVRARRDAVLAHERMKPAKGDVDDDFVPPPAAHDPAPKASTGFVVTKARRRIRKYGTSPQFTPY